MGFFSEKMKEPVFLKESSNAVEQLRALKELEPQLDMVGQSMIKNDIKLLEHGILGEKNIVFELKNSHMPMYVLQDVYLHDGSLSAQIDFLVFTKKLCFVIECKNLYGNIEVNNKGDFIRSINFGGTYKKEGIYSPITQNLRHLELMKKIKLESKKTLVEKLLLGKYFDDVHRSIVVLANQKTVLNMKFAKKEIKEQVIRSDQLISFMRTAYGSSKIPADSDEKMFEWAQSYLQLHRRIETDYTKKFEQYKLNMDISDPIDKINSTKDYVASSMRDNGNNKQTDKKEMLFEELRLYRLYKSREEDIKPYLIYNNNQLNDLISRLPHTIGALIEVDGFGEVKANKYGADILRIIQKYS